MRSFIENVLNGIRFDFLISFKIDLGYVISSSNSSVMFLFRCYFSIFFHFCHLISYISIWLAYYVYIYIYKILFGWFMFLTHKVWHRISKCFVLLFLLTISFSVKELCIEFLLSISIYIFLYLCPCLLHPYYLTKMKYK